MKTIYTQIREKVLPYQNKRDNAGHAFITLEYAKQLVDLELGRVDIHFSQR